MEMYFQSCLAPLIFAMVISISVCEDVFEKRSLHRSPRSDGQNPDSEEPNLKSLTVIKPAVGISKQSATLLTGSGLQESLFASDRSDIVSTVNEQRSLVGAADMNYLPWNSVIEEDVGNWTTYCDLDARVYSSVKGVILGRLTPNSPNLASILQGYFSYNSTFYTMRSIYLTGVSVAYSYCPKANFSGQVYSRMYLMAYGLPCTSNFSDNVKDYSEGAPCSGCEEDVNWCYNSLCRGDCDISTFGCCEINTPNETSICATMPPTTTTTATTPMSTITSDMTTGGGNSAYGFNAMSPVILIEMLYAFRYFMQ